MLEQATPLPNPDDDTRHLPAPLPPVSLVLQRTQSSLGLLREVVQESSAEYWCERGKAAMERGDWEEAVSIFQTCLSKDDKHQIAIGGLETALRNKIKSICDNLKEKRTDKKYDRWRESKYEGGSDYAVFDERLWRDDNEGLFEKIVLLYETLSRINNLPSLRASIWIEAAQIFDGSPFRHPKRASGCYCKAFAFDNSLANLINERRQSSYYNFWCNWPEAWSQERIMSLDAAIELFPNYYETYWLRGDRHLASENYQEAADDFETYFRLGGPEIRWRYQNQARAYFKANSYQKFQEALINLQRLGGDLVIKGGELIDPHEDDLPF